MKALSVLGSTGSIGRSVLDVVEAFPDRFRVVALAAGRSVERLAEQVAAHKPKLVSVAGPDEAAKLKELLPRAASVRIVTGSEGLDEVASLASADVVVGALVGALGLRSAYAAVRAGKRLALANKETLVVAGELMLREAKKSGAEILPIDSEHSAIHQALRSGRPEEVERIVLTASGGPFRERDLATFDSITVEDALAHPTWKMGPKITIDSATMMNKGLEVIEARWLFDEPGAKIDIVLHPQSIVHSMVEYVDGSVLAQMSPNDMRFPILYALTYPDRVPTPLAGLDLTALGRIEFIPLDETRYPAVPLAYAALASGGSAPAVLNAANEIAVQAFLDRRIRYQAIVELVARVLGKHRVVPVASVADALAADAWARREAASILPLLENSPRAATARALPA